MYCDLHTHSVFSDGTDRPEALVEQGLALGLKAIALCDHNSVSGLPFFLEAARGGTFWLCRESSFPRAISARSCTSWPCLCQRLLTPP